jgi:predicted nucleotidyltransferase
MTIEDIKKDNRLLYRYIAGSKLYHCDEPESDTDTKGLFIASLDENFGLGFDKQFRDKYKGIINLYNSQIGDDKSDNVFYEVGKYMGMLLSSNSNVLESLFVPEEMMIVKPHCCLDGLFANRDKFITKACFEPFVHYAIEQIKKARGMKKKIVNPIYERLTPFDFAYTFYKQGSTKVKNWLDNRGLNKDFCGLVHIPNMHDTYGVYYDWGAHFEKEGIKTFKDLVNYQEGKMFAFILDFYELPFNKNGKAEEWFENNKKVLHYRGMCLENATDMRGSSVSKGEKPLCWMVYNESGFKAHCKLYKEYKDWEKNRNPRRYESNLSKNYDSKNMYHCVRLIRMGKEIANGDGIILDRREAGDRDLIMDIRHHKFEYDELLELVNKEEKELNEAIANSKLPDEIDVNLINDLLIDIRKKYYGFI